MKTIWAMLQGLLLQLPELMLDVISRIVLRIPIWILFWKKPATTLAEDIHQTETARAALKGFDLKPLKWLATLALIASLVFVATNKIFGVLISLVVFGVAYLSYFLFLLLRRISCGLLEWTVLTGVLGSVVGFIVSYPGMSRDGWTLSIFVTIASGFVLESFVRGLSWILVLNTTQPLMRVGLLLSALAVQWVLALWVAAILSLDYFDLKNVLVPMVGNKVLALGPVFLVLAVLSTATWLWISFQLNKVKAELKPISV